MGSGFVLTLKEMELKWIMTSNNKYIVLCCYFVVKTHVCGWWFQRPLPHSHLHHNREQCWLQVTVLCMTTASHAVFTSLFHLHCWHTNTEKDPLVWVFLDELHVCLITWRSIDLLLRLRLLPHRGEKVTPCQSWTLEAEEEKGNNRVYQHPDQPDNTINTLSKLKRQSNKTYRITCQFFGWLAKVL